MDDREMARYYAVMRMSVGLVMFLMPGLGLRLMAGDAAGKSASAKWMARLAGGRDLLLGAGAYTAYKEDAQVGRWCRYGMVADFVDAVSTVVAYKHLRPRWRFLVVTSALTATATGGYLSTQIGD